MAQFKIGLYEDKGGYCVIEAKTEKEAKAKAISVLEDYGIEGFKDFNPTNRQFDVVDIIKIN